MSYTRSANVFVMGPAGVGKTELVRQWVNPKGSFQSKTPATIGTEYNKIKYQGLHVNVSDTGGQERFRTNYSHFLESAHVVLCCFDSSNLNSFTEATEMLKTALQNVKNRPYVVFVGTKFDSSPAPVINQDHITQEIAKLKTEIPGMDFHPQYVYTSAKESASNPNLKTVMDIFFNRTILSLCENALDRQERAQPQDGAIFLSEGVLDGARTPSATYFQRHPNVRMGLAIAGLVIGLAAIALATVATCGVAGLLGVAAASVAATLTFGASLTTVGAVAGGVGLFGGLSVAGGAYLMHTRPRAEVVENNGSPFGGENSGEASDEATQSENQYISKDLLWTIKQNSAVRFFAGVIKRAGECFQLPGSRPL